MAMRDDSPIENFQTFAERLEMEGYDVYRADNGLAMIHKMSRPSTLVEIGARRFAPLLQALVKPDEELTEQDRRTICQHDPRVGFYPHDDWKGARDALSAHYKF